MFPDRKTAKSLQVGPEKLKHICNFGLAPFFKTFLAKKFKKSEYFVISYDEIMNEGTHNCQMDVLIRYFNEDDKQVKVRQFTNAVNELKISMDGSSIC